MGNILKNVPQSTKVDTIIIKNLFVIFTDDEMIKVLEKCHEVLIKGGKFIIVNSCSPEAGDTDHRREKLRINDLRVLYKTRTHSTHALIFGAPRWIAVATGNILHENESRTEIRREPFIRAVLVLDKTCSYKWYSSRLQTRLIFPRINGPIMTLRKTGRFRIESEWL